MKNKAVYILTNLALFLIIDLLMLLVIQGVQFPSYWIPFSIGGVMILVAVICTISLWKKVSSPIVSIVLNALGVAFLADAYLIKLESTVSATSLLILFVACIGFYVLFVISLYIRWLLRKAGWFLLILSILSLAAVITFWVIGDAALFSNVLFSLIMTISMTVCAISEEEDKNSIDKNIKYFSFSSLIIFIVVLSLLLESGDFLEGIGPGFSGGTSNRKAPQNIIL